MAQIKIGEDTVNTSGELPGVGAEAPAFVLTGNDLADVELAGFRGKNVILNIFPSIDTRVCAMSVREFNQKAGSLPDTVVLCISKDLPFAMKRFCGAEGLDQVVTLSDFRHPEFGDIYGVNMLDGRMQGLYARAVVLIGPDGKVRYTELVPSVGQEPDYEAALQAIS